MDPSPNPPPAEGRNWAELSPDALSVIFGKIGAVDIPMAAGRVCRAWRRVAREPLLWRRVDLTRLDHLDGTEMEAIARMAVDWSAGRMEEFSAAFFGSDELLLYIAERANLLKSLRLISCYDISDEGLTEMVKRFHCLEKLEIIFGSFTMKLCESIGQACPQLKLFKLNTKGSHYMSDDEEELDNTDDCDAFGIAKTMHELRQLQLFGNKVTNEGLKAILNSCPHLESLDIRRCFNLNMDASMKAMCSRIRNLRLPEDSADDYAYDAAVGSFDEDDDDDIFSEASEFDDMMYDNDFDYDYIDYDYQYGFGEDDDHPNLFFLL